MKGFAIFCGLLIAAVVGIVVWFIVDETTEPESGTVVDKQYHAAWLQMQCTSTGKVTSCIPIQHPECYEIVYRDGDSQGDACVAPQDWERYGVGDEYPAGAR